jgi:hypothetical protein
MSVGLEAQDTLPTTAADVRVDIAMPIWDRLNTFLTVGVFSACLALLWLGSRMETWYTILAVGTAFSYLMLTNYARLHEAVG